MSVSVRRDIVVLACAISAGIHGALAPAHFSEGVGAGAGFVAAAALLGALSVAISRRRDATVAVTVAALAFAGLLVTYLVAVTTGLPFLHPEPEPVDGLALVTKAVEAVGLVAASTALSRDPRVALTLPRTKGTLT